MLYFAYGSNMSTPRLIARVGEIRVVGHAWLPQHEHRFSKLGRDGTGKGNVEPHAYRRVHGVMFRMNTPQFEQLASWETGYRTTTLEVHWPEQESVISVITFVAIEPVDPPPPSRSYLDHYREGFLEHGLPSDYAQALLRDAGDPRPL